MKFSFDTIQNFDKHIELSIPNYTHIHELIESMSGWFIKPNTNVYDLGCSTGTLLEKISKSILNKGEYYNVKLIGYDSSENMRSNSTYFNWKKADIRSSYEAPLLDASLILSIFTIQFLNGSDKWNLVERVYKNLNPGGAFIVTEKVYMPNGIFQNIFNSTHYDYKRKSFTDKEIWDKEKDLRSIMSPMTEDQIKIMFREAGFKYIETFFTSLMFKGWVLIK